MTNQQNNIEKVQNKSIKKISGFMLLVNIFETKNMKVISRVD